jgi:hypothetical protein
MTSKSSIIVMMVLVVVVMMVTTRPDYPAGTTPDITVCKIPAAIPVMMMMVMMM